jgi:hypothetical protein
MTNLEEKLDQSKDPCKWSVQKLATYIRMKKKRANILVEGKSDEKSFINYFDRSKAKFIPDKRDSQSKEKKAKEKIKNLFENLRSNNVPKSYYFAISDRDYDCFRNTNLEKKFLPNWFYVDSHSLETWILSDDNNFQNLIDHAKVNWIDSGKLKILERKKINLKEIIFNIAKDIGVLRLISLRVKGLNVSFNEALSKRTNILKFISPEKVLNKITPFDRRNFLNFLFDNKNHFLRGTNLDIDEVSSLYKKEINDRKSTSPYLLAHGHDLCKILHIFFTHKILSGSQDQVLKNEKNFAPREGDGNSVELKVQKLINEQFLKNSNLYINIKSSAYYAESLMV